MIIKGADVNKGELSPLFRSCFPKSPNIRLVKLLLEYGADLTQNDF